MGLQDIRPCDGPYRTIFLIPCDVPELLNWECLLGAMAELERNPDHTKMVETYVFNSAKVFATFTP